MTVTARDIEASERILDVALDCFVEVGIRRTSMDDIARAAGVGRTTVFRRFESKDQIVRIVVMRIVTRILEDVRAAFLNEADLDAALTEAVVASVRAYREDPLFAKVMRTEPDAFLGTLTQGESSVVDIIRASVTGWLGEGGGGPLSDRDAEATGEILIRLGISLIVAPGGMIPIDDDEGLRSFLLRYVAPGVALLAKK